MDTEFQCKNKMAAYLSCENLSLRSTLKKLVATIELHDVVIMILCVFFQIMYYIFVLVVEQFQPSSG